MLIVARLARGALGVLVLAAIFTQVLQPDVPSARRTGIPGSA